MKISAHSCLSCLTFGPVAGAFFVPADLELRWCGSKSNGRDIKAPAMTHRDTAAEAIGFAIEMLGKDFTDVVIIDADEGGRTYAPFEFKHFYRTRR